MYNMDIKLMFDNLSGNLIKLRENKGVTIEEVAEMLNIRPLHLKRMESGLSKPNMSLLIKISRVYRVLPTDLLIRSSENILEYIDDTWVMSSYSIDKIDLNDIYNNIAENARFMRKNIFCLTFRNMGTKCGISYQCLQNIEFVKNKVSLEILIKLCNGINYRLEDIIHKIDHKYYMIKYLNDNLEDYSVDDLTRINKLILKINEEDK